MMKTTGLILSLFASLFPFKPAQAAGEVEANSCAETLDFSFRELNGKRTVKLCDEYKNKTVLIVNTASKCGYTPQFDGLEKLFSQYKDKGFAVIGFPSNDFGNQDPGSEKQIQAFCRLTYGVKFPMYEKTHAAEKNASPIYQKLGSLAKEFPSWNFHKYLINPQGELIGSFPSRVKPFDKKLVKLIEESLPEK